jgi:CPA1 family monovalent cation:H+ antiporter
VNDTFARAELFVVLLAAMLGLTALARKLLVPYPILLVLGGLALAFIPGVPELQLDPDLVFVVFLPPILWGAAYFTSLRDFKRNLRSISGLAIGLVVLTTLVVGWVAHTIIPGMSWAVALCLGAIVSPPDAVAATAVMSRIGVPRKVITILEGESLVNDASALVLYRAAVMAIVSGTFSLGATVGGFFLVATVGVLIGLAVGWLTRWAVRHMSEGYSQIAITLLGPYIAWIAAERLHSSAVLACVAGGLYVRQHFSSEVAPVVRLQARTVWELLIFLLNGIIFITIGLQLGPLRRTLADGSMGQVLRWGVIITLTAIVVRLLWLPVGARLVRIDRRYREINPLPPARSIFIVGLDRNARHRLPRHRPGPAPHARQRRADAVSLRDRPHHLRRHPRHAGGPGGSRWRPWPACSASRTRTTASSRNSASPVNRPPSPRSRASTRSRRKTGCRRRWRVRVRGTLRASPASLPSDAALDPECSAEQAMAQRRLRHEALTAERRTLIALRNRGDISDDVMHQNRARAGPGGPAPGSRRPHPQRVRRPRP